MSAFGQGQKAEYSINGTVRNDVTGEPVRSALVALLNMPAGAGPLDEQSAEEPQTKTTLSGPGGEFHFEGLTEGLYAYVAHKPGFAQDGNLMNLKSFAIPRPSADAPVRIQLSPLGAIEGKVVNQYDEPLEKVLLDVHELRIEDGEKILNKVGTVWTDDRGAFRLTWLEPGNYLVKVVGMTGGTETHFGPLPTHYAPWEGFSPIYFGGATSVEMAAPIPVAAGSHVRADFRLEVEPIFRIRGQVQGYVAPETVSFELLREDERAAPSRALLDVTTGKFEILDVTPGKYKLRATQGKMRGEAVVNVGGDVSGVSVALLPPATINGSWHSVGGRGGVCQLNLRQPWYREAIYGEIRENSQFSLNNVFPGQYQVRIVCHDAYVQSASSGGVDLLTNPVLTIRSGAPTPPIELVYIPGGGSVKVKFANPVPPDGAVLVVPASSASASPALRPMSQPSAEQPGENTFRFSGLAPGDYLVYGLPRLDDAEFRNPAFLRALSGGVFVHIEDGKTAEVTITRISK